EPLGALCIRRSHHDRRDRVRALVPSHARLARGLSVIWFFGAFAILEYLIYFRHNPHFFQGDTIYWFYFRHRTIGDFFISFFNLDPAGWYRPLAARTVQSLFFLFFGLEPEGYRLVVYLLFMYVMFCT